VRGGLVPDVRDAADLAVLDQLGDLLREVVRVDLVRQGRDDERLPPLDVLLDLDHGAHGDRAAAGAVRLLDAPPADDERPGGEVRALDPGDQALEQLLVARLGVPQRPLDPLDHLAEVVRGDVGRHADGDPRRAVDEQVGEPRRENLRLL